MRDNIIIFLISLFLFTVGLTHQEIISFESRFYLFALEMWRHGPSFFPTTYHMPYADYPGLSTFLIYVVAHLAGGLNKTVAVFPSACASALTVVLTYRIGALENRRLGIAAVLFLFLTLVFIEEARTISLDCYVMMVTVSVFYLIRRNLKYAYQHRYTVPIVLFFLLALGFAFRGPIGLVIPAGVMLSFYFVERDVKSFFIYGAGAALLLLICTATLLGLAYHEGGKLFAEHVLHMQVLGRLPDVKAPPFYFYFRESVGAYALTYPLAILLIVFNFKKITSSKTLLTWIAWVLVILIGLSIPGDKKVRYVLPMAPALALICAYFFAQQKGLQKKDFMILALGAFVLITSIIFIVEPINLKLNRTRELVLSIEKLRHAAKAKLIFYREGRDGLAIKYLVNMPDEEQPIFVDDPKELINIKGRFFILVSQGNDVSLKVLPLISVIHGRLGRDDIIVFHKY